MIPCPVCKRDVEAMAETCPTCSSDLSPKPNEIAMPRPGLGEVVLALSSLGVFLLGMALLFLTVATIGLWIYRSIGDPDPVLDAIGTRDLMMVSIAAPLSAGLCFLLSMRLSGKKST